MRNEKQSISPDGHEKTSLCTFSIKSSRDLPEMTATWASEMLVSLSRTLLISGRMMARAGVLARKDRVPSKSRMTPSLVQLSTRGPRCWSKSWTSILSMNWDTGGVGS